MPNRDRRICPAKESEDPWGIMGANTRQRARLIGHPLSLQPIRESLARLSRISAPPPSPVRTGGARSVRVSLHLSVEWDGVSDCRLSTPMSVPKGEDLDAASFGVDLVVEVVPGPTQEKPPNAWPLGAAGARADG